jgi:hypothetical protein
MLRLARVSADAAGVQNVEFLKGFIEDLPLPDAVVEVVISTLRPQRVDRRGSGDVADVPGAATGGRGDTARIDERYHLDPPPARGQGQPKRPEM